MKILYLVHQFYPMHYTGTEKFILHMATMMQKYDHRVKVVTYSFYEDSFYDRREGNILFKEFTYTGIPVLAFKYKNEPEDLSYGLTFEDLAAVAENIIKQEMPDIVHVGHPMRVHELMRPLKSLNIPFIITLTDFWLMCPKGILMNSNNDLCGGPEKGSMCKQSCPDVSEPYMQERLRLAMDIMGDAHAILTPSRFVASAFKKEMPKLDIKIINHGMSYEKIIRKTRTYSKDDYLTFFYGGTLSDHKGVHIILDAFTRIRNENVLLKIYGSGHEQRYIDMLHEMAGNDSRIEFCGVFSEHDIGKILNTVDVIIVPSLWFENYPLVLHEALACNVPVLASNVGGMAEKIKDGVNGYTFQIGDADNLKQLMEMLIENPAIINELQQNIKNFLIPTIEQEAYAYERVYKKTVARMLSNAV